MAEATITSVEASKGKYRVFLLDCETTGLYSSNDRIVELAVQLYEPGQCLKSMRPLSILINPGVPCRPAASAIHGLTDEILTKEASFPAVWSRISAYVHAWCADNEQAIIVAHNAQFDASFISAELKRYKIESPQWFVSCSLELARSLWPGEPARLGDLAHRAGVDDTSSAHRAAEDVKLLAKVLDFMDESLSEAHLNVCTVLSSGAVPLQSETLRITIPKFSLPTVSKAEAARPTVTPVSFNYETVNKHTLITSETADTNSPSICESKVHHSSKSKTNDECGEDASTDSSIAPAEKKNHETRHSKQESKNIPNQGWTHTRHDPTPVGSPPRSSVRKIPDVLKQSSSSPIQSIPQKLEPQPVTDTDYFLSNNAQSDSPVNRTDAESRMVLITRTGKRYHVDEDCEGLVTAGTVSEVRLSELPRPLTPCLLCCLGHERGGADNTHATPQRIQDVQFEGTVQNKSNYYHTRSGAKYHIMRDCYGLRNAYVHNLIAANNKPAHLEPCKICVLKINYQFY